MSKHPWTTLLWELWAAQTACAAAALLPGSRFSCCPELVFPGLMLALVTPAAWAVWGIYAALPPPLPPETLLEDVPGYDLAAALAAPCAAL